MKNQTFVVLQNGQEVWKSLVNGKIIPAEFNSKGAALAGIEVEKRRQQKLAAVRGVESENHHHQKTPAGIAAKSTAAHGTPAKPDRSLKPI